MASPPPPVIAAQPCRHAGSQCTVVTRRYRIRSLSWIVMDTVCVACGAVLSRRERLNG